jgi:outer membrane protein
VVGGLAQVSALQAAERSSQLALDSNKLGYEVGVRINIDVLNAQQQLFSAQRDLSRARYETLLASLRLKAAVGNLLQTDLEGIQAIMGTPTASASPAPGGK